MWMFTYILITYTLTSLLHLLHLHTFTSYIHYRLTYITYISSSPSSRRLFVGGNGVEIRKWLWNEIGEKNCGWLQGESGSAASREKWSANNSDVWLGLQSTHRSGKLCLWLGNWWVIQCLMHLTLPIPPRTTGCIKKCLRLEKVR